VSNAEKSQFLEGDIRLAQRFYGLEKQGLNLQKQSIDLQQEQVNFNKKMLPWRIGIQGAQALASIMNAGTSAYSAFDNYAKQKEIKILNQAKNDLEVQITQDILNGKTRMTLGENGEVKYTGLTPEAEAIRERYREKIREEMGGIKWGNAGRASDSLDQMYSDLNVGAAKMIADKTYKDVQNEFQTNLQNAIQEFIKTGDRSFFDQTMNQAKEFMSDEVWNNCKNKAEEDMRLGRTSNEAKVIAQSQGMDAARTFLEQQNLTEDQRAQFFAEAQQSSNQAVTAAVAGAMDTYNQMVQDGATFGDAYRAAIVKAGNNPAVAEAVKDAAQRAQRVSLSERFGQKLAGSNAMSVERLRELRREFESYSRDYQDQGMLYRDHLAAIDSALAAKQQENGGGHGGGGNPKTEAENMMAIYYDQFNNKEISGPTAIRCIDQIRLHSPTKAAEFEAKILGGGQNPAAEQTYLALDGIIQAYKPESKASANEKMEYEQSVQNARQAIFQAYFDGVRGEELTKLVDGYRKEMASQVLRKLFQEGTIGSAGWFGNADKNATAFAYHSAQGNLDLRYSERTTDARRPDQTTPLTVGGEKAERVMQQAAERNRDWVNDKLKGTSVQLTTINYERDANGDRDGTVSYIGSNGKTYRVNATAENGNRFLEVKVNNRWERIDFNDVAVPHYSRHSQKWEEFVPPGYYDTDLQQRQQNLAEIAQQRRQQIDQYTAPIRAEEQARKDHYQALRKKYDRNTTGENNNAHAR